MDSTSTLAKSGGVICALFLFASLGIAQTSTNPSSKTDTKPAAASSSAPTKLLDLNTATRHQLEELPGIGDADYQKIVDGRPYKDKAELLSKNILPKATYDKIAKKVTAVPLPPPYIFSSEDISR